MMMNETRTKIEAAPDPDDPFFVNVHVSRVIDGETPYEFMHNMKLDLRDAEKLETVVSRAVTRSKEIFRQHLEAEYDEMRVTEAKAMERALDERREKGLAEDSWSIPVDPSFGAPITFLKEVDEDDTETGE